MGLIGAFGLAATLLTAVTSASAAPASEPPAAGEVAAGLAAAHLPEPLVATGPTGAAEDAALLAAVSGFETRRNPDDFSTLTGFLAAQPKSAWRAAVLTDLGLVYRHYGYFSRALDAWQQAWHAGKDATGPRARALVDRAVGELVRLDAALGYRDRLAALLNEIGDRPVRGPGSALVQGGRATLWIMNTHPRHLYNCGPLALKRLILALHASEEEVYFLNRVQAQGPKGTSLAELAALAKQAQVALEPVFRKPGEKVPVPAIAHWRVGHFAAIVGERDGRFEVSDPTLGRQSLWVTQAALDAEASGYFLVPFGAARAADWRKVATAEAEQVWGAGNAPPNDNAPPPLPTSDNAPPPLPSACGGSGLCGYRINEEKVSLILADMPLGYTPPIGPSAGVSLAYDMYDVSQPANFGYFNVGQKWTLNWLSFVQDEPGAPGMMVSRYDRANGFLYAEIGYKSGTGQFTPEEDDASVLVLTKASPVTYQRVLRDGTVETYADSDGSKVFPHNVFLSRIRDPQGNALTLHYSRLGGQVRLASLTDATGRITTFGYGSRISPLLITQVTDPFGRSAELRYDIDGRLISITDVLGLTSQFTYDAASLINSLTTPYGATRFTYGKFNSPSAPGDRRFLTIVDPLGIGEREETFEPTVDVPGSVPFAEVPRGMANLNNSFLAYRNSFHWNKHQYAVAACTANGGCNYHDARTTHFTHDALNTGLRWSTIESVKQPLENRVWYTTPGQLINASISGTYDQPNAIGRVLDNGQTQLTQFAYNAAGNPTEYIDPLGRRTNLTYAANQIDVVSIAQTVAGAPQTTAKFTYNGQHRPLTYADASGQMTHYTYNGAGQLTSITNPLGQRTSFDYDATGDLIRVVNAGGKTAASFTYDSADRVASYTDAGGRTVKYDYDAANRPIRSAYPDRTTEKFAYDKLDLASFTDRNGRVWRYAHDADRRLTAVTDPLGHVTTYTYFEDGTLKSLTDPNGHTTSWDIDVESRPIAKHYADGTVTTYNYEITTSRLASVTDALGQTKNYQYALDDRLAGVSYQNAVNPTPNVAFTYDPYFARLTSMTDSTGTTSYSYVPVGALGALRLEQESSPLPDGKITYAYDPLGRVVSRTVGGASPETFQYDAIGRLIGHTDALGKFAISYLGETGQMIGRHLVGRRVATAWSYLSNTDDRRLAEIDNKFPNERQFHYTTNAEYLITKIVEEKSGRLLQSWGLGYDRDNRLLTANSSTGAKYGYTLDPAGNITKFAAPSGTSAAAYNQVNALTKFAGTPFTYDADGNLLSDGVRTYSWDAENRLAAVTRAGVHSSFAYDGLGRRIAITDTASGRTTRTHYVWCGRQICQSRNGVTSVQRLYYPEGEVIAASKESFYYGPDQVGSVRDVFASSPAFSMVQSYDYDPYGDPTTSRASGPLTDFRYAGMFYHSDSGLYLTRYRAYDPRTSRWLSRDPIGENGGINVPFGATYHNATTGGRISKQWIQLWGRDPNLYKYVLSNPINLRDPNGLQSWTPSFGISIWDTIFGVLGAVGAGAQYGGVSVSAIIAAPSVMGALGVSIAATAAAGVVGAFVVGIAVGSVLHEGIDVVAAFCVGLPTRAFLPDEPGYSEPIQQPTIPSDAGVPPVGLGGVEAAPADSSDAGAPSGP
jgi:RHS repeat-associated protein